jgi:hypothetical protein
LLILLFLAQVAKKVAIQMLFLNKKGSVETPPEFVK